MPPELALLRVLHRAPRGDAAEQPPPWRGQRALRRRLGQVRQGLGQPEAWRALGTRAGGEVVSSDSF